MARWVLGVKYSLDFLEVQQSIAIAVVGLYFRFGPTPQAEFDQIQFPILIEVAAGQNSGGRIRGGGRGGWATLPWAPAAWP